MTDRIDIDRVLTQQEFDAFARLSGDDNPIHVDPDFAARSSFGRTVAHGVMLYSILRGLVDRLRPGWRLVEQEITFPAPTYAGELMRFSAVAEEGGADRVRVRVDCVRVADGCATCAGFMEIER